MAANQNTPPTAGVSLKPCPNPWGCSGSQAPVCTHFNFDGNSNLRHVVCHSCGLRGPVRGSEAEAITAWNTRTAATADRDGEAVKHMVERFLTWKLPENFNPDAGISFKAEYNDSPGVMKAFGLTEPMRHEPTGTNLFGYTEAEAMVRHMLEGLPALRGGDEEAISIRALLAWIEEAWPEGSSSDFNQGVVRGFEIIKAQLEHAHIQQHGGIDRLAEGFERECSPLHCEYPYGPCCGAAGRNDLRREGSRDATGKGLLLALRKDVGDEIVEEIEAGFEGANPLKHTLQFISRLTALKGKPTTPQPSRDEVRYEELTIQHGQQVMVTFKDTHDAFALFNELKGRAALSTPQATEIEP